MTKQEIILKETQLEKERRFSEHITPPAFEKIKQVDSSYDYMRKGFFNKIGSFFAVLIFMLVGVVIRPFYRLKIKGKKNLKKAKRAILTSNHINPLDCVLLKHAVGFKGLRITVADFNNPKGFMGCLLRAGGTMPIGKTIVSSQNLSKAIGNFLNKDYFVLFYPEGSMWWNYDKPRPLIRGAAFYAVKYDVPEIPMFFTYRIRKFDKNGVPKKSFTLNIGEPIYPDKSLDQKSQIDKLNEQLFEFNKTTYEQTYGKKLEYLK